MYKQLTTPDHVIAMHLSGKLTVDDINQYKDLLEDKLKKHAHMNVLVEFTGLSDMNAEALVQGMKADLEFFSHIDQFSRCAFISDKEWPQAVINFISPIFPTFEMKVFTSDKSEEAVKWVAETPKVSKTQPPAFRFLRTTKDEVFAFEINGVISAKEMPEVIKKFEGFLQCHDKVRLLNRMKHFGGIDPAVFMQSGLVSMKLAAMQKVERYAIVGAPAWMRKIIETVNPAFEDIDMQTFSKDHEREAWAWLGAESAE